MALVVSQPLGPVDSRAAISAKLELLGARIAHRLGKHVTHVVFQRVRNSTPQERQAEESEIRNLYDKLAKVVPGPRRLAQCVKGQGLFLTPL